ncbi:MAG: hypothetical protein WCR82_02225 [Bacteroidales bacterium]
MKKLLTLFILPVLIIALAFLIVRSINQPVKFNSETEARSKIGIERLKDIRTLQIAFKSTYGRYSPTIDSLVDFYNNGKITIVKQIGSLDDSLAVAKKLIKRENIEVFVRDTLFNDKPNFKIDSLTTIPFSGGDKVIILSTIKSVSGVDVPLFEASMPYSSLLKGLDKQLIINLVSTKEEINRYPGLQVGSITNPNNNAGNWE